MIERDVLMLEFKQFLPLISEENISIIRDIIDTTRGRMNAVFEHIGDEIRIVGAMPDHTRKLVIQAGEERVHAMYERINHIIANTDSFNLVPENVKVDVSEKGPDVVIRIKPRKKDAPNICTIDKTYPNN